MVVLGVHFSVTISPHKLRNGRGQTSLLYGQNQKRAMTTIPRSEVVTIMAYDIRRLLCVARIHPRSAVYKRTSLLYGQSQKRVMTTTPRSEVVTTREYDVSRRICDDDISRSELVTTMEYDVIRLTCYDNNTTIRVGSHYGP